MGISAGKTCVQNMRSHGKLMFLPDRKSTGNNLIKSTSVLQQRHMVASGKQLLPIKVQIAILHISKLKVQPIKIFYCFDRIKSPA